MLGIVLTHGIPSTVWPCPPLDVLPSFGVNALSVPKIEPLPMVKLAGIGVGVGLGEGDGEVDGDPDGDGDGDGVLKVTLLACKFVAQLPVPLLTA